MTDNNPVTNPTLGALLAIFVIGILALLGIIFVVGSMLNGVGNFFG